MDDLTTRPSLAITIPVGKSFDYEKQTREHKLADVNCFPRSSTYYNRSPEMNAHRCFVCITENLIPRIRYKQVTLLI